MCGDNLCRYVLINVNKIVLEGLPESQYIQFARRLDNYLRQSYPQYYICDQVNKSSDCSNVYFVEAFYRNVPGIYEVIGEIGRVIKDIYDSEFACLVQRTSITSFSTSNQVYPKTNSCSFW